MKSGYQIGINEKKTCSIAICNWDVGSCLQGECHAPQQCVSNNGWNGERCDQSTDHKVSDIEWVVAIIFATAILAILIV